MIPRFRKQYQHRCHSKPKAVAKVAAAAQVGHTTVLDATHAEAVSGSGSHREQSAGAPGRPPRRIDRDIDWALSHPVETECSHRTIMAEDVVESMVGGTMSSAGK